MCPAPQDHFALDPDVELSFAEFFNQYVEGRISGIQQIDLISACAGNSKESLDEVDLSLHIQAVVRQFGHFVKYCVRSSLPEDTSYETSTQRTLDNTGYCPKERMPVHNNKDHLFNSFVGQLKIMDLFWPIDSNDVADRFASSITEALWYLDGHHDLLSERSTTIPDFFSQFQGYNQPERSKHRKRTMTNLSYSVLEQHVDVLSSCLQCTYWDSSLPWRQFKTVVMSFVESLVGYMEHLSKKQKISFRNHRSPTPIRSLGDNIQLISLPVSSDYAPQLNSLVHAIEGIDCFSYVYVNDYAPEEPFLKFRYIENLKNGINTPALLFVHSPGSNIGNQYYIWKVTGTGDDVFSRSQRVIEEVKSSLPTYHTRAMRKAMYNKYGRVCPSLKPAALRFLYHDLTGK